jgi:lysophospholipase L1-like esterase
VLTPEEQAIIRNAQQTFNQTLANLAQQYDIALADVNALLVEVNANGLTLSDGRDVTTTYATGGAFSLDGIHPSPRGNAVLANVFIEAINAKYGSNLPGVDPLDYTGLYLK